MKRYERITIAGIILTAVVVFWFSRLGVIVNSVPWQRAVGALIDMRYVWQGEWQGDTNIVLVGVTSGSLNLDSVAPEEIEASKTLQKMREPYPWDRSVWAATLEKLMQAGAKVVVFDFVFAGEKEGDEVFAKALEKYRGRVVIGSMFELTEGKYVPPNARLFEAAGETNIGFVNLWPDPDGVTRRGRYRTSREREHPSLSKVAALYPDNLNHMTTLTVEKFAGKVETPPYDRDNFIEIRGSGIYEPIPIETLFIDKLWNDPPLNGETRFRNKIVIVGPMAAIFHDIHNTPHGSVAGPELQAHMMATLLNRSSMLEPGKRYQTLLNAGMVVMALVICLFASNAVLKSLLLIGTVGGFVVACQYAFMRGSMVVGMLPPLFGLVATGFSGLVYQFLLEQIERRRYRGFLDRYVSKSVAARIIADRRSFEESLKGEKKAVTILFSDIRGFTTMTEGTDATQLVSQLNEYFKEMVEYVDQEEGTLHKFIGDAIMAAWGDTHSSGVDVDARRAVRTALQMRAGLAKLNIAWKARLNRPVLDVGIGLNHGEVVVGNVGSHHKTEWTALGDAVNLAARLETATKQFHVDLLVGESVEALTREHFVFRCVGLLTVKGKTKPVEAFHVLSEKSQEEPKWLRPYHEAIANFRRREFQKAAKMFEAVQTEIGGNDFLCEMYLEWCEKFEQAPPPEGWAGNFVLGEK